MYTKIIIADPDNFEEVEEILYQADIDFEWDTQHRLVVEEENAEIVIELLENNNIEFEE